MRPIATLAAALAATLLVACSSYGPPKAGPGANVDEIVAQMGPPTGRYALADGERLEFARGPYGRHTWMVDVGADGRVRSVEQVLDEAHFARVVPGMPRDELQRLLGRPSDVRGARTGELLGWRYETNECLWFVVTVARDGRVRDAGQMPDPICDRGDKDGGADRS